MPSIPQDPIPLPWSQACAQSVRWKSLTQLIGCNGVWIGPFREQVTSHFFVLLISGRHRHCQNPLLGTRWVRSQYCSQIKQQREKFSAELGFEPRAAGLEARMLPLRKAAPLNNHPLIAWLGILYQFWRALTRQSIVSGDIIQPPLVQKERKRCEDKAGIKSESFYFTSSRFILHKASPLARYLSLNPCSQCQFQSKDDIALQVGFQFHYRLPLSSLFKVGNRPELFLRIKKRGNLRQNLAAAPSFKINFKKFFCGSFSSVDKKTSQKIIKGVLKVDS